MTNAEHAVPARRARREERPAWCSEGLSRLIKPLRVGDTQWVSVDDFARSGVDLPKFQIVFDALRGLERTGRVRISRIYREAASGEALVDRIAVEKLRD